MGLGFWDVVGGCFVGGWRGLGGVAGRVMVAGFGVVGMAAAVEVAAAAAVGTGFATAVADIVVAHMNFPILVSLACIANSADYRVGRSVDAVPLGVGNPKPLELAEQNFVYFGMHDLRVDSFHIVELSVEKVIVVGKAIGRFAGGTFGFGSCSWVFWVAAFSVVAIAVAAVAVAVAVVVFAVIVAEVVWVAVFEDSFEIVTAVVTAAAVEMAAEGSLVEIAGMVTVVVAAAAKVQVAVLVVLVAVLVVVAFGGVDTFALAVADKPVIVANCC